MIQANKSPEAVEAATGRVNTANQSRIYSITKQARILAALKSSKGLNRFEAERLGDHCLNSTIATLRRSYVIRGAWETVPCRFDSRGVRVMRYWLAE